MGTVSVPDNPVSLQGAQWIPGPLSRDLLYDQQVEAVKDYVEVWRDVPDNSSDSPWETILPKMKKETVQVLRQGQTLKGIVRRATSGVEDILGGVLTVTPMGTGTFETWKVEASKVKVRCVPKEIEFVKEHYSWLPEIDWVPE